MSLSALDLRSNDAKGWIGSIIFHAIVAIILLLWKVSVPSIDRQFIEVTWGKISNVTVPSSPRPSAAPSAGQENIQPDKHASAVAAKPNLPARKLDLPERRFDLPDESLPIPQTRKIDVTEQSSSRGKVQIGDNFVPSKDRGTSGTPIGRKEKFSVSGKGEAAGNVSEPGMSTGSGVGEAVAVSVEWNEGGTRKKIGGELPSYPSGVKVEAQIKIEAVVEPDGSVKSCKPTQKGNTKLEEVAMEKVRLWMFEKLRSSLPQKDQTCVITFNYRLQ